MCWLAADGATKNQKDTLARAADVYNIRKWQEAEHERRGAMTQGEMVSNAENLYRIGRTTENKPFVEVEEDILDGVPEEDWIKTVKNNLKEKFPDGVIAGNNTINIDNKSRKEMTYSGYMKWLYNNEPDIFADKLRVTNNADEIVLAATNWVGEAKKHERRDNIENFARGSALIQIGNRGYSADVVVATRSNGNMLLYDILNMEPTSIVEKETDALTAVNPSPEARRNNATISNESIPQSAPNSQEKVTRNPFEGTVLPTAKEQMERAKREERAAKAETEAERTGILLGVPDKIIQEAKRLSQALGIDVVFYPPKSEKVKKDKGYYNHDDGKIYLNATITDPVAFILGHEMVHHIQLAESYVKFVAVVLKKIQQDGGDLAAMRKEIYDRYLANGVDLNTDIKINQELVAEYAQEHLFTDEESITSVVNADRESGKVIRRFLDNVLAKLGNTKARERVFIENARRLYARALGETANMGHQGEGSTKQTDAEKAAAYSLDNLEGIRALREETEEAYERGEITEAEYDERMDILDAEASMAGESLLYDDGRQYAISRKKGVAKQDRKGYNKKQIKMNPQEYTLVKSAIMKKESTRTAEVKPGLDSVYAYNKYYLYEPAPEYNGVVIAQFEPETDWETINEIERSLSNGSIRDKNDFDRRIGGSRLRKGNNSLHNVHDEDGRAGGATGGVPVAKLGSDSVGHSGGGVRNQSGVGLEAETDERQYAITKDAEEALGVGDVSNGGDRRFAISKDEASREQNKEKDYYDYSKLFAEQINDYKANKFPKNDTFIVGKTEDIYLGIGFNSLPVTLNQTHVDYALKGTKDVDHFIGETMLKQLPDAIKNPVAVIRSASNPGRVVALLPFKQNGKTVIAPFEIDGQGINNTKRIDSNSITSVFGKGNIAKQLADALNAEANGGIEMFYWNKKEALSLLQGKGLQLPSSLPQDGFIHSIREKGANVNIKFKNNTQTQQFKRWFSKSKVRNADGTPKVVYHGTNKNFSIFKSDDGTFWFSESRDYAEAMAEEHGGDNIISAYLAMKNPYYAKLSEGKISDPAAEKDIIRKAKENKHDGVIIECDTDNELAYDKFYVVFEPTQIKSATDNIGTFDGNNPNIQYSIAKDREKTENVADNTEEDGGTDFWDEWLEKVKEHGALSKGKDSTDNMAITQEQYLDLEKRYGKDFKYVSEIIKRLTKRQAETVQRDDRVFRSLLDRGRVERTGRDERRIEKGIRETGETVGVSPARRIDTEGDTQDEERRTVGVAQEAEERQYAIAKDTETTSAESAAETERTKIKIGMDDKARYEILKNKRLKVANYDAAKAVVVPEDLALLKTRYKKEAAPILRRLAADFGVIGTYKNEDIDLEFDFSNTKLGESINKQKKAYQEFGKMLSVFKEVVENAVGIETHPDKYKGTPREDPQLKQTYVLVSAFREGKNIYPVRLTVKEFKGNIQNSLHVAVCFEKIKDTISEQALSSQNESTSYPPVSLDISLAYLLENVKDEDLKKYIPEEFNGEKKREASDEIQYAIAKDTVETKAEETEKTDVPATLLSQREVEEVYAEVKRTRRNLEKVQRRIQLSEEDKLHVGRLLRGELTPEYLPEDSDKEGILAVYEAKREYENYAKQIRKWNEQRKEGLRAKAREYLGGIQNWKDKTSFGGLRYSIETKQI